MNEIDQYALIYFFRSRPSGLEIAGGYVRHIDLIGELKSLLLDSLEVVGGSKHVDVDRLSDELLVYLTSVGAVIEREDKFAGSYYKYEAENYRIARGNFLNGNKIDDLASEIGDRFFVDAFNGYSLNVDNKGEVLVEYQSEEIPASDRIVSLSDNQIIDLDEQAEMIINAVSAQNQIDAITGLREIVLGQLKAGRELIRAGSFKLYVLEVTLIHSLEFLAKRYEHDVIGALASVMIAALAKHMGVDI